MVELYIEISRFKILKPTGYFYVISKTLSIVNFMVNSLLSNIDTDRIIEMAWEDRTPFDAIKNQFGLTEAEVINLMRNHMRRSSFQMWRKRVSGRKTKHRKTMDELVLTFKCSRQKSISNNKISKR